MKKDWEIRVSKYFKKMQSTVLEIVCCRRRRLAKKGAKKVLSFVFLVKTYVLKPKVQLFKAFSCSKFRDLSF
jgi:hypothetical protein